MATLKRPARNTAIFGLVLGACLLLPPAGQAMAEIAGTVSRVKAEASATTEGRTRPLARLSVINTNDTIRTGPGARLEITLRDGTKLTLGANGALTVDTFIFRPDASSRRILVDVAAGAFRFISGKLANLSSDSMIVRTQAATIGIRGTDFWGGIIDSLYGVFLFEGAVEVSTRAGQALLDRPGTGVSMADADAAPGPVVVWPRAKVLRAAATVAF